MKYFYDKKESISIAIIWTENSTIPSIVFFFHIKTFYNIQKLSIINCLFIDWNFLHIKKEKMNYRTWKKTDYRRFSIKYERIPPNITLRITFSHNFLRNTHISNQIRKASKRIFIRNLKRASCEKRILFNIYNNTCILL